MFKNKELVEAFGSRYRAARAIKGKIQGTNRDIFRLSETRNSSTWAGIDWEDTEPSTGDELLSLLDGFKE